MNRTKQERELPTTNFYFTGLEKSSIIPTEENIDKSSTAYIIFQNDSLHKKVKELEDEIHELKMSNNELENDNESLEISKTRLQGYIKNQAEYNKLSEKLTHIYDTSINNINKHNKEIENTVMIYGSAFILSQLFLLVRKLYVEDYINSFIHIAELTNIVICIGYIFIRIYIEYIEIVKIRNIRSSQPVIRIKAEIKDSSKGNDYLNELIDNI